MATRTTDRWASSPKNGGTKARMPVRESSPGGSDSIEVNWDEVRTGRTGVPSLYFLRGIRTPSGWLFEERDAWEISWFPVPRSHESVCIRRAQEILLDAANTVGPAARRTPEVGNFHDNVAVLAEARAKFAEGRYDDAEYLLTLLRDHIAGSPDPKSKGLLPEVDELLTRAEAAHDEAALHATRTTPRRDGHTSAGTIWSRVGVDVSHQVDSGHRLKGRLIEATVLATTFVYAMGLLVHEIGVIMPDLAPAMLTRNVFAASILAVALFLIRSRGG